MHAKTNAEIMVAMTVIITQKHTNNIGNNDANGNNDIKTKKIATMVMTIETKQQVK